MKLVKLEETGNLDGSEKCKMLEYILNDSDISCVKSNITGRYPDTGYCVNQGCKELLYVMEGNGTLNKKDEIINFDKGDVVLIDKGEAFFFDANCTMVVVCTPAWYSEQHKIIEG